MDDCSSEIKQIILSEKMTHNEFDFYKDLIRPMIKFLLHCDIDPKPCKRIMSMSPDEAYYLN